LCACRKTAFESAHDKAVVENPAGVELRIAIVGERARFHVFESVPVEEYYTAKYGGEWHLEVLDGWNEASVSDVVHINDGVSMPLLGSAEDQGTESKPVSIGIVCCDSRHVWLSFDPVRLPYQTPINTVEGYKRSIPRSIRFSRPGHYELFVTTQRVFDREQQMTTYSGLGYTVTSRNVLSVEIVQ